MSEQIVTDANHEMTEPAPPAPSMALLAGTIFALLFYVIPLGYLWRKAWTVFPSLGETNSFLLQMAIAFLAIWGACLLLAHYEELIPALEGARFTRAVARLNRATGQRLTDLLLTGICLAAAICLARRGAWPVVPLPACLFLSFLFMASRADARPWPIPRFVRTPPIRLPDLQAAKSLETREEDRREISWHFRRAGDDPVPQKVTVWIPEQEYLKARSANPTGQGVPGDRATRELAMRELVGKQQPVPVSELARRLGETAVSKGLNLFEQLCNALAMVQQGVPFVSDQESIGKENYWRYPVETLRDQAGDSADKAILLAAVLKVLFQSSSDVAQNLDVVLLVSDVDKHAAVAVGGQNLALPSGNFRIDNRPFYFCETRPHGRVGGVPDNVKLSNYQVIKLA